MEAAKSQAPLKTSDLIGLGLPDPRKRTQTGYECLYTGALDAGTSHRTAMDGFRRWLVRRMKTSMESHREGIFDGIRHFRRNRRGVLTRESKPGSPRARACDRARVMEWSFASDGGAQRGKRTRCGKGASRGHQAESARIQGHKSVTGRNHIAGSSWPDSSPNTRSTTAEAALNPAWMPSRFVQGVSHQMWTWEESDCVFSIRRKPASSILRSYSTEIATPSAR